jgi:2-polyprenyl-3-methyl-5-hydroxy-6-metoxy-1,4-benzoquinol methylase
MNHATIEYLNAINCQFYETTAADFDQTRGRAWAGWQKLGDYLQAPLSVLDPGCGNGRFGLFLAETLAGQIDYHGIDSNAQLLRYAQNTLEAIENISATLTEQDIITEALRAEEYDLVVLFGVIHHIPGAENRKSFMKDLAQHVKSGGILCFAAWRFYEYERFRERLVDWDEAIQVEQHDYLLDWRRGEQALRYCHYVDDAEHQQLIAATGLTEITTYRADGSDNVMNCYTVLRRGSDS